jgi:fatty acid desaturase
MSDVALDVGPVRRSTLVDHANRSYLDVRRTLTPRYGVVWASLLAGHLALWVIGAGLAALDGDTTSGVVIGLLAVAGGVLFGFWLHYLLLFQHEGVHFHLARTAVRNDQLTNLFIGSIIGEDVRSYRKVHFGHHRHLGTPQDTERSYFDVLNRRFVLESLLGIRLIKTVLARRLLVGSTDTGQAERSSYFSPTFIGAGVANVATVVIAWVTGRESLAIAWVLGVLVFMPMFNALRQVLEHRSEFADRTVDYAVVPHGSVNRIFGDGLLARLLGSAGFNRHLLHHWDPDVSCTRLGDLEEYLLDTEVGPALRARQTTYLATLRQLAGR